MTSQFAGAVLFDQCGSMSREDVNAIVGNLAVGALPQYKGKIIVTSRLIMAWRPAIQTRPPQTDGQVRHGTASRDRFMVVGSLLLDNRRELISELGLSDASSNTDIVQELSFRLGVESLGQRLFGSFAFAVWDRTKNNLTCYTDRIGLCAFYYAVLHDRFLFSWSPVSLSRHPDLRCRLNLDYFNDYLQYQSILWMEPATAFEPILRLRPGHRIQVLGDTVQESLYWDPTKIGRLKYKDSREYADQFRGLLKTVVRSKLQGASPFWFDASGGLDSTSIIYLASEIFRESGSIPADRMRCRSIVHRSLPEFSESDFIVRVTRPLGLSVFYEYAEDEPSITTVIEMPHQPTGELGLSFLKLPEICGLCNRIRSSGADTHLGGHGADHLLGAPILLYLRNLFWSGRFRLAATHLDGWARASHRSYFDLLLKSCIFPRLCHSANSAAAWLRPRKSAHKRKSTLHNFSCAADQYLFEHVVEGVGDLATLSSAGAQFGVARMFPFEDARLLEFILCVPPEQRAHPPLSKWLLREAMRGFIPEDVRTKWFQPTSGDVAFIAKLRRSEQDLLKIIRDAQLADLGFVEPVELTRAFKALLQGDAHEVAHLAVSLSAELWLRTISKASTRPADLNLTMQVVNT